MVWPYIIVATTAAGLAWYATTKVGEEGAGWAVYAKPAGIMTIGGAIAYGSKAIPEKHKKYKPIPIAVGVGLIGFGAYELYKAVSAAQGVMAKKGETYSVNITEPHSGEVWSMLVPWHSIAAEIVNPYNEPKIIWVGASSRQIGGAWCNFKLKRMTIPAKSLKKIDWWFEEFCNKAVGNWEAVVAVWDVRPTPPCEQEGTCWRLGEGRVNFSISWSGLD